MKNVITYSTKLPNAYELEDVLKESRLPPLTALSAVVHGFVPHPWGDGERFVLPFEGGYSFAVQTDEKIVPLTLVASKVNEKIKAELAESGRDALSRKEKVALKEQVYMELLPNALHKSRVILGYYNPEAGLLMLDTSSDSAGSNVIRLLIKALGTLKATTIHVSDLKMGLQVRLKAYLKEEPLEGTDPFQGFAVGTDVKLVGVEKEKVTFAKLDDVFSRRDEILTLLEQNYQVTELALTQGGTSFRLSSDFIIKGVKQTTQNDGEWESAYEQFQHESAVKIVLITNIIQGLCSLLGYDKEVEPEAEAA